VQVQINDRNEDNIRKERRHAQLEVIMRDGRAMLPKDQTFEVLERAASPRTWRRGGG